MKKKIKNICYYFEIVQLKNDVDAILYKDYMFKDLGYITYSYDFGNELRCWKGFITPIGVRNLLGNKQWSKFCQGKREFVKAIEV